MSIVPSRPANWIRRNDPGHIDEPLAVMTLRTLQALQSTLLAGVTTVRNAGVGHFLDVDVRSAINAGIAWGPRVLACGPIIRPTGGYATGEQLEVPAGPWAVREAVRTCLKRGVDAIKLLASGAVSQDGEAVDAETFTREEMIAYAEKQWDMMAQGKDTIPIAAATKDFATGGVNFKAHAIDTDHDGTISKAEFVAYAGKKFDSMKKTDNMVSVADMARAISRGNTMSPH